MNIRFITALLMALKDIPKSKTLIFGYLLGIFGVLQTFFDDLRPIIPDSFEGIVLSVIGLIVVILRYLTTRSVQSKRPDEPLYPPVGN